MKKIISSLVFISFFLIILTFSYLTIIGHETDKFNSLLENKIASNFNNTKININKIKIKIDIKNLSFFVTTTNPNIKFFNNKININKIDAYINLKSLIVGKPKIEKVNIVSDEIEVDEIKNIVKYLKPSNFKRFFLNEVKKGKITFNLDLNLKNNEINNYEINGIAKNFFAKVNNIKFEKSSFIYSIKKDSGEIDNLRGYIDGFQINSGNIQFDNTESLIIRGDIKTELKIDKKHLEKLFKEKKLESYKNFFINGTSQILFEVKFDNTLKIIDYHLTASGNIKDSDIKFEKPKKYAFLKKDIDNLNLEKSEFKLILKNNKKNSVNINGSYKLNNNELKKFDLNYLYSSNLQQIKINADFSNEIFIPFINYSSENKVANIKAEIETKLNQVNLKNLSFIEGKNKIVVNNLLLKNNKLFKFNNISVKTFINDKLNNDFDIVFGKEISIKGSKYDATNLTKVLERDNNSNFLENINREISVNIRKISTNISDKISNFNLIGNIEKGQFNKIVSKGEFQNDKYLDISLRQDIISKKKILEIYSDLPKTLLSNYKFFDGLTGGQLLFLSSYDAQGSETNLTIENFKVKDAPGLVKLLSLADFGGMVDALSGEGLSFEKLEINMEKNNKVLNLKELYAIGPSISILMEGYVESKTGLVSLRGTMVPAKTLNKFLSKLPIVGDIIIPKEIGEGLFGISFKMKGTPGKIKTSVNPIKSLTPRFIQKALKKPK